MEREFSKHKVEVLSGGTWFTSTTFQVVKTMFTHVKVPKEKGSTQVFKGSLLDCEAYLRLKDQGYI